MPRLSRDVVAAREALATKMFSEGKSADEVQKALQAGWNGMKMAPGRLAEIQESVEKGGVSATPTPVPPEPVAVDPLFGTPVPTEESRAETPPVVVVPPENPKKYNPAADGFLDFCRAKARAAGMLIVGVSEDIYSEWLESKG